MNTVMPDTIIGEFDECAELKELYDDYWTARLNEKYYGWRLASTQTYALIFDVVVAVGASSSFATLKVFSDTDFGKANLPYLAKRLRLLRFLNLSLPSIRKQSVTPNWLRIIAHDPPR